MLSWAAAGTQMAKKHLGILPHGPCLDSCGDGSKPGPGRLRGRRKQPDRHPYSGPESGSPGEAGLRGPAAHRRLGQLSLRDAASQREIPVCPGPSGAAARGLSGHRETGTAACGEFRGPQSGPDRLLTSTSTLQGAGCSRFTITPGPVTSRFCPWDPTAPRGIPSRRGRWERRPTWSRQTLAGTTTSCPAPTPTTLPSSASTPSRAGWNRMNLRWPPPTRGPVPATWRFIPAAASPTPSTRPTARSTPGATTQPPADSPAGRPWTRCPPGSTAAETPAPTSWFPRREVSSMPPTGDTTASSSSVWIPRPDGWSGSGGSRRTG